MSGIDTKAFAHVYEADAYRKADGRRGSVSDEIEIGNYILSVGQHTGHGVNHYHGNRTAEIAVMQEGNRQFIPINGLDISPYADMKDIRKVAEALCRAREVGTIRLSGINF
jgi:hypothetical protein